MKIDQIGIQLYTLGAFCKTREAFVETCGRVAKIGYQAVQVSGIDRKVIPESEIAAICADHGLTICATHEASDEILRDPERVVERLRMLGTSITAYPYPAGIDFSSEDAVAAFIRQLEHAGEVLDRAGMILAYHNHHIEFRRLGGRLLLERIYAETNPRFLQGEIDTYWVQYGGGDPVAWCRRLGGRLPILHLKDYQITAKNEITFAEVGSGNLDIPSIVEAAEQAGCEWFVVEQDSCPGDPFDSIAESFEYLRGLVAAS